MSMSKRPVIRFKGYDEPWGQCSLGKLAEIGDIDHRMPETVADGIPYLMTGDFSGTNELNFSGVKTISESDYEQLSQKIKPEQGDIIFARYASVGAARFINFSRRFLISYSCAIIKQSEKIDSEYLYHFITSVPAQKQIKLEVNAGTQANIGIDSMKNNIYVSLPSEGEQTKIADMLTRVDEVITLHQRKYDKLLSYKNAMLEKMFPKDGADVPEVRFAGFTKPWIKRRLLDNIQKVVDFRGRTPKKLGMEWSTQGYLALSALNVKDGYIDFSQDVHYGDQQLYDKWMAGNDLHKGQVVFTTEAPMGNVAQIPDNRHYILSQRTIAFEVIPSLITEGFLATLLRTPLMFSKLTALSSGGTAKGVSQRSLAAVETMVSEDLKEQEAIANFFLHLDNMLSYQLKKVEGLRKMKNALLERMFV